MATTATEGSNSERRVNDLIAKLDTIEQLASEIRSELAGIQFETPMRRPRARALSQKNTSGYRGVSYVKARGVWQAYCRPGGNRRRINLGTYGTPEDAAKAYDAAAIILFGPNFDGLNFPDEVTRNAAQ